MTGVFSEEAKELCRQRWEHYLKFKGRSIRQAEKYAEITIIHAERLCIGLDDVTLNIIKLMDNCESLSRYGIKCRMLLGG